MEVPSLEPVTSPWRLFIYLFLNFEARAAVSADLRRWGLWDLGAGMRRWRRPAVGKGQVERRGC